MNPVVRGSNDHGYSVVKQPDGTDAVMSDKGKFYKERREGAGRTVLSMSEIGNTSSFKKCIGCGTDLLPKWNKCEACGKDQYATRP